MSIELQFKEFAMKGNVVDLADGVIIGARLSNSHTAMAEVKLRVMGN